MKSTAQLSLVAVALTGLALVGCNGSSTDAPVSDASTATDAPVATDTTVEFKCPGGETITAQFIGTNEAVVTLPDAAPVTLPATEAASGARYSDGTTTLWNKGDEVLVEVNNAVVLSECKAQN